MKYSASQISLAQLCLRRWAFVYRLGQRRPAGKAADAGTKVHDILERYLRDGAPIDPDEVWQSYPVGRLALVMAEKLPPAGTCPDVEREFNYTVDGLEFTGRIDLETSTVVYDHKTTSKVKYVKTELEDDTQAIVYAARPEAEGKDLQWTTGVWATETAVVTRTAIPDAVERLRSTIVPLVQYLDSVPVDVDPLDLPAPEIAKNSLYPAACGMYPPGGCEWLPKCSAKGFVKMEDLISKIQKRSKSVAVETAVPTVEGRIELAVPVAEVLAPKSLIGTLYINCLPLETDYVSAHRLIGPAAQEVCDDQGLHHVRLADWAKGGPMLAAQVRFNLAQGGRIERVFLDARTPEGREVEQVLLDASEAVVRGV